MVCPECGQPGQVQSPKWRAPRRTNDVGWKRIAAGDWLWCKPRPVPAATPEPRPYNVTRQQKDALADRLTLLGATIRFGTKRFPMSGRTLLIKVDARAIPARHEQAFVDALSTCPSEDFAQVDLVNVTVELERLLRAAAILYRQIAHSRAISTRDAVRVHFTPAPTTNAGWSLRRSLNKTALIIASLRPQLVLLPHTAATQANAS